MDSRARKRSDLNRDRRTGTVGDRALRCPRPARSDGSRVQPEGGRRESQLCRLARGRLHPHRRGGPRDRRAPRLVVPGLHSPRPVGGRGRRQGGQRLRERPRGRPRQDPEVQPHGPRIALRRSRPGRRRGPRGRRPRQRLRGDADGCRPREPQGQGGAPAGDGADRGRERAGLRLSREPVRHGVELAPRAADLRRAQPGARPGRRVAHHAAGRRGPLAGERAAVRDVRRPGGPGRRQRYRVPPSSGRGGPPPGANAPATGAPCTSPTRRRA